MANRILRDWTSSESVDCLSAEAERFFTRLIMKADDYGSFYANPKLIRSALFPLKDFTDKNIIAWVEECEAAKVLFTYEVDGKKYLRIDNFGQRLRNMRGTFPQPDDKALTTRRESPPETKRNETNEKVITRDVFDSKQTAFEELRDNDQYIEDCTRTLSGRGWLMVSPVDVIGCLKQFLNGKCDLRKPRDDIKQHFKNWLIREDLKNLQTFAEVFRTASNGRPAKTA